MIMGVGGGDDRDSLRVRRAVFVTDRTRMEREGQEVLLASDQWPGGIWPERGEMTREA